MEEGLQVFLSLPTALLCLGVYVTTEAVRRVIELVWKNAKQTRFYTEILLPLGPIGNGALIALCAKQFPWPEALGHSLSAKVMYGAICGLFSGWMYARVRKFLGTKTGVTVPPPPGPNAVNPVVPPHGPTPEIDPSDPSNGAQ